MVSYIYFPIECLGPLNHKSLSPNFRSHNISNLGVCVVFELIIGDLLVKFVVACP